METEIKYSAVNFDSYLLRLIQMRFFDAGQPMCWYRELNYRLALSPDETLERLSQQPGWQVMRINRSEAIVQSTHCCMKVEFNYRGAETPCLVKLWADSATSGRDTKHTIEELALLKEMDLRSALIDWVHPNRLGSDTTRIHESFSDEVLAAAYPWPPERLADFTQHFLASSAPVLILYGPPGTGKTRLVRHLLGEMSQQRRAPLHVIYTTDAKVVTGDQFFANFMASDYDAMVIEDADHLLKPRSDGNENVHRFLAISDGLLQPRGRRLIFTTNLPSRIDIDEALTRPGRCFACVAARKLTVTEARAAANALKPNMSAGKGMGVNLDWPNAGPLSLAEVYAACYAARHTEMEHGQELSAAVGHAEADPAEALHVG